MTVVLVLLLVLVYYLKRFIKTKTRLMSRLMIRYLAQALPMQSNGLFNKSNMSELGARQRGGAVLVYVTVRP